MGQSKSTILLADSGGVIGSGNGGDAVKAFPGKLIGLSFVGGAAHAVIRIYDGLTIAGGTQIAAFFCGATATGAHFDCMDINLLFRTGLSVAGNGLSTSASAPLNQVTLIYE